MYYFFNNAALEFNFGAFLDFYGDIIGKFEFYVVFT